MEKFRISKFVISLHIYAKEWNAFIVKNNLVEFFKTVNDCYTHLEDVHKGIYAENDIDPENQMKVLRCCQMKGLKIPGTCNSVKCEFGCQKEKDHANIQDKLVLVDLVEDALLLEKLSRYQK